MDENVTGERKAAARREGNRVGLGLLAYTFILYGAIFTFLFVAYFAAEFMYRAGIAGAVDPDRIEEGAIGQIAGVVTGVLVIWLYGRGFLKREQVFRSGEKMPAYRFIGILCVFMCGQAFFTISAALLELVFNSIGFTVGSSIESATADSTTVSMFIYTGLVAPIAEELVYRGFVMHSFLKFGRVFAISASALLFGIMHANLPQGIYAFYCGIILGYVTERYSIRWAILLHTLNNLVFGDLFLLATDSLSDTAYEVVSAVMSMIFLFGGVVTVMYYHRRITAYYNDNRTAKGVWPGALTSVMLILFAVFHMIAAFLALEQI